MKPLETSLDAIVAGSEPIELPRLTVANVFVKYNVLGGYLEQAVEAYKAMPNCAPAEVGQQIKDIVAACAKAIATANRLLEANL